MSIRGTVYVPAAPGGITLYGTGEKPIDVKIGLSLDGGMSPADWRHDVNPRGKYMPGKPAWYMYDSCQSKRSDSIGVLCSAVFWSQNNGLQLQNLTIENTLGDSVDAGNHPAVALRTDGDPVHRLTTLTFSVVRTPSLSPTAVCRTVWKRDRQPRTLVTNSYIEGDVDIVSGRGAVVFDNTEFRVVNSRTQQEAYVFAPATLSNIYYGFLAVNSRFNAFGDGVAQLGRSLDVDANTNGQVVIRDSAINEGFNTAKPWADAVISNRPFAGNTGSVDDNDEIQRNLNDTNYNRMWEYNNRGVGSKVVAEAKK
ncbi:putative acyl-CoA thioester hydrolase [Escherichia coli]